MIFHGLTYAPLSSRSALTFFFTLIRWTKPEMCWPRNELRSLLLSCGLLSWNTLPSSRWLLGRLPPGSQSQLLASLLWGPGLPCYCPSNALSTVSDALLPRHTDQMTVCRTPSSSWRETTIESVLYGASQWLGGKESTCSAGGTGVTGSIPGSGRSLGEGNGNPLQHFCLENSMDSEPGGL